MAYSRKRKYSSFKSGSRTGRLKSRYSRGTSNRPRFGVNGRNVASYLNKRVRRIERTIETKEACSYPGAGNLQLQHNEIRFLINPFGDINQGTGDPMGIGGNRIGDKISLKGMYFVGMLQNTAGRPKVFYRLMLVKYAKGDTPTTANLFKGCSQNKMIDQVNTEKYTIIAQKTVTVSSTSNGTFQSTGIGGQPITDGTSGGVASKIIKMWVPGSKICRNGDLQFESNSLQTKFFDYRWVILVYDWYGTPSPIPVNNVGSITECYSKLYYKDA